MQDASKAVWSIPYVSLAFFPSLKQNFIAYHSSKVSSRPDCIFEIHQLWQSGFSRMYSNSCCSCSFKPEIIKIGQSSHKMYSNNILNFQESTTILNVCTKKSGNLLKAPRIYSVFFLLVLWNGTASRSEYPGLGSIHFLFLCHVLTRAWLRELNRSHILIPAWTSKNYVWFLFTWDFKVKIENISNKLSSNWQLFYMA